MTNQLRADLVNKLKQDPKSVVFVVGAGVTIGALHGTGKPTSWGELIKDGLAFAFEKNEVNQTEYEDLLKQFETGRSEDWIAVAQTLTEKLGGRLYSWLKKGVGTFHESIRDRSVLDPLADFAKRGALLLTTNYDHVLEEVIGQPAVVGIDSGRVDEVVRGKPGILHVHGSWSRPDSVVLGIKSYDDVQNDKYLQHIMRALPAVKTLVFLGCGEGLKDPNWGPFVAWVQATLDPAGHEHYRLCNEQEWQQVADEHRGQPIVPLVYGKKHADLGGFLQGLVSELPALPVAKGEDVTCIGLLINVHDEEWSAVDYQDLADRVSVRGRKLKQENCLTLRVTYKKKHLSADFWRDTARAIDEKIGELKERIQGARPSKVQLHIAGASNIPTWLYLGQRLERLGSVVIFFHNRQRHSDSWDCIGPRKEIYKPADPHHFVRAGDNPSKMRKGRVALVITCSGEYKDGAESLAKVIGDDYLGSYVVHRPKQHELFPMGIEELRSLIVHHRIEAEKYYTQPHIKNPLAIAFGGPAWAAFWFGRSLNANKYDRLDFLFDMGGANYVPGLSFPMSRAPWLPEALRVLVVAAEPVDQTTHRVSHELDAIVEVFGDKAKTLPAATPKQCGEQFFDLKPHIVHITCHGDHGKIALVDHVRRAHLVSGVELAQLLSVEGFLPEILFVSACKSDSLLPEIKKCARIVLTCPEKVSPDVAHAFAVALYRGLQQGKSLSAALALASVAGRKHDPCMDGEPYTVTHGDELDLSKIVLVAK